MAFVDTEKRSAGEVQQKVGRLKLSEAIRIGARLRPKAEYHFFDGVGTCALGAAAEARGWSPGSDNINKYFLSEWNDLGEITKMNDCGTPREVIADWLAAQGL